MRLIVCIAFLCLLASCTPRMYFPDKVNSPGFVRNGELRVAVSGKSNSNVNSDTAVSGFNEFSPAVEAAYSVTDHIGIIASYHGLYKKSLLEKVDRFPREDTTVGGVFNGYCWEIGAGYFTEINKHFMVECYTGVGIGEVRRRGNLLPNFSYDARYTKVFIQPAVGLSNYQRIRLTGGCQVALYKYHTFISPDAQLQYEISNPFNDTRSVTDKVLGFVTIFANTEFGIEYLKFNVQVGGVVPCNNRAEKLAGGIFPLFGSIGLVGTIPFRK